MLELIELYSEVIIREEEILYVFDHSAQGSKLCQLMIDELRWEIQEDYFTLSSSDARFAEVVGPIFLEASLKASGAAIHPEMQKERYLEVLTVTDED